MTDHEPPPEPKGQPKYGERAPEGWKWVPPADAANPDGVHPVAHPPRHTDKPQHMPAPALSTPPLTRSASPTWDRTLTIVLLFVGLIGMLLSIGIMSSLPQSLQTIYDQDGLGTYSPAGSVPGLIVVSCVCQVVIWLLSAALSIFLLVRRRHAFYVPIIAGIVAGIVLFIFIGSIVTNDPTLVHYYSNL